MKMTKTEEFIGWALFAALAAIYLSGLYVFLVHVLPYWFDGLLRLCPVSWLGFLFVLSARDPKHWTSK